MRDQEKGEGSGVEGRFIQQKDWGKLEEAGGREENHFTEPLL